MPAKVITVFNNKGGVGKTTLLCNLASYLSLKEGKRVIVVDADPQCNATIYSLSEKTFLPIYEGKGQTIQSFLEPLKKGKGYSKSDFSPIVVNRFGFSLIAGDPGLALSEDLLASDWKTAIAGDERGLRTSFVFGELFKRYEQDFDYIFVDVSPSLGAINRSVLIASDYFLMPMSSDIFSLMAVSNIGLAVSKWRRDLTKALEQYKEEEGSLFTIGSTTTDWKLRFCGYVTQQYTAKSVRGTRVPVKAYDKVIKKMGPAIKKEIVDKLNDQLGLDYLLGTVPNLNSIIPLSQNANAPIFDLKWSDGVVGAHFDKVKDAENIMSSMAKKLESNLLRLNQ